MFTKILVANRGEIACRIIRTLRKLNIRSVAIYSDSDAHAMHVSMADESIRVGPPPASQSYLNAEEILDGARKINVEAIHPGYGFLSENTEFAYACEAAGIRFVGPFPDQIRSFGLKHVARELAEKAGVPLLPGSHLLAGIAEAQEAAARVGYPVMLKSSAGGGGIGLQLCRTAEDLKERFETVRRLGEANFKQGGLYLEKYVEMARHIEVQIFGDGQGGILALGERDCSVQRRNQKIIEETPAPKLTDSAREALFASAIRLGKKVNYASAGTIEFIYDVFTAQFYFLEANTRLQVEHGITEEVTGIDIVEWMIRLADGSLPPLASLLPIPVGHSLQVRIYAEDPAKNFQPSAGLLTDVAFPEFARIDTWVEQGTEVSPYYDPLIAKIIVKAATRELLLAKASAALASTRIHGIETNQAYLAAILNDSGFAQARFTTAFLSSFVYDPATVDVLEPGTQTSVQDFPGRLGFWAVGVPPSGPMDPLAFQLGNRLLGNSAEAAGLEITMSGPTLRFNSETRICLTGAPMNVELDGTILPFWEAVPVRRGQTLRVGRVTGGGARAYLTIAAGFDVPKYLGSRSTFALGHFGGHGGRVLRTGDVLRMAAPPLGEISTVEALAPHLVPTYDSSWEIGVLYGPHGAPDFFTSEDIETFFAADWKVHYNSNRTGVRLIGPKPNWARKDGGEAGLHPSNIHDNAYAIGAIDFTGDMPIILGPDGPSLGGFVCPAVIADAEVWKLGQLKAGDTVRFRNLTVHAAEQIKASQQKFISSLEGESQNQWAEVIHSSVASHLDDAILADIEEGTDRPRVVYRGAGDSYLLVEYGLPVLDLNLRFRVHALMEWVENQRGRGSPEHLPGLIDLTPGIRSLQIHYDPRQLKLSSLLDSLRQAEKELPRIDEMIVPTRIVHLPLSWEDESTLLAIEKYMQSVRADAPWCPSNLEFIRRVNGLASIDEVRKIVFDASYLVLGLGDVYLGAPVATPIDPRHRLVTTKYNPARTWTPENAVGIGGAYMCIYGMEGPGGYQFIGRTIQVWNRFKTTREFEPGKPWLLRFFDQIRFYPTSAKELLENRGNFLEGRFSIRIDHEVFRLRDYNDFLQSIEKESAAFKVKQQAAFEAERERWASTEYVAPDEWTGPAGQSEIRLPEGYAFIDSPVAGNLWKILVQSGDTVAKGQSVAILESMKMEMQISAPRGGKIDSVLSEELSPIDPGQHLFIIAPV